MDAPEPPPPGTVAIREVVDVDLGQVEIRPAAALSGAQDDPPPAVMVPAAASWYGPGMWGNRTACGLTLTDELLGVAHRTLPCGAAVTLRHGANTVTVPVVDRGPYVMSREFDLTYATRAALACPDLCSLSWLR